MRSLKVAADSLVKPIEMLAIVRSEREFSYGQAVRSSAPPHPVHQDRGIEGNLGAVAEHATEALQVRQRPYRKQQIGCQHIFCCNRRGGVGAEPKEARRPDNGIRRRRRVDLPKIVRQERNGVHRPVLDDKRHGIAEARRHAIPVEIHIDR